MTLSIVWIHIEQLLHMPFSSCLLELYLCRNVNIIVHDAVSALEQHHRVCHNNFIATNLTYIDVRSNSRINLLRLQLIPTSSYE
jgi:hypothetical protein